jgi:NAD(P)-dependent dehydrogenase (short-subunit alcohol dehydrogenase family)
MRVQVKGRNVLVTGSSMGIGKGLSECFAKAGANLVLADHPDQHERLEEWAAELGPVMPISRNPTALSSSMNRSPG